MRRRLDLAMSLVITPRGAVPRRADHRAWTRAAGRAVWEAVPDARGRRRDGPAHHPVPGGGRPARRPDRRDRRRPRRRAGHRAGAQARVAAECSRSTSPTRPSRLRVPVTDPDDVRRALDEHLDAGASSCTTAPGRRLPGADAMTASLTFVGRSLRHSVRSIDALLTAVMLPGRDPADVRLRLRRRDRDRRALRRLRRARDHRAVRGLRLGEHRRRRRAGHDDRRRSTASARCRSPSGAVLTGHVTASVARNVVSTALVIGVALIAGFRPVADPLNWLAAAAPAAGADDRDLLDGRVPSACSPRASRRANALTFVAAFAPYVSQRVRPGRHDARRACSGSPSTSPSRRSSTRCARSCWARRVGNEAVDRVRVVRGGHRRRPARRRLPVRRR